MCAALFFNALRDGEIKKEQINMGIYITALVAITGLTVIYIGLLYLGATGHEFVTSDMSMATMLIVLVEQASWKGRIRSSGNYCYTCLSDYWNRNSDYCRRIC